MGASGTNLPPVLTPAQAAEVLHCDRNTVYRWLRDGVIPGRRMTVPDGRNGRRKGPWRINTEQLLAHLEKNA